MLCPQIYQITQGLQYMHEKTPPIIHGDLKAVGRQLTPCGSCTDGLLFAFLEQYLNSP